MEDGCPRGRDRVDVVGGCRCGRGRGGGEPRRPLPRSRQRDARGGRCLRGRGCARGREGGRCGGRHCGRGHGVARMSGDDGGRRTSARTMPRQAAGGGRGGRGCGTGRGGSRLRGRGRADRRRRNAVDRVGGGSRSAGPPPRKRPRDARGGHCLRGRGRAADGGRADSGRGCRCGHLATCECQGSSGAVAASEATRHTRPRSEDEVAGRPWRTVPPSTSPRDVVMRCRCGRGRRVGGAAPAAAEEAARRPQRPLPPPMWPRKGGGGGEREKPPWTRPRDGRQGRRLRGQGRAGRPQGTSPRMCHGVQEREDTARDVSR